MTPTIKSTHDKGASVLCREHLLHDGSTRIEQLANLRRALALGFREIPPAAAALDLSSMVIHERAQTVLDEAAGIRVHAGDQEQGQCQQDRSSHVLSSIQAH